MPMERWDIEREAVIYQDRYSGIFSKISTGTLLHTRTKPEAVLWPSYMYITNKTRLMCVHTTYMAHILKVTKSPPEAMC